MNRGRKVSVLVGRQPAKTDEETVVEISITGRDCARKMMRCGEPEMDLMLGTRVSAICVNLP